MRIRGAPSKRWSGSAADRNFDMKVSELIAALEKLPPEAKVFLADWNEGWHAPMELKPGDIQADDTEVVLGLG